MIIETEHDQQDIVYLKTDIDQLPRIVIGFTIIDNSILYILSQGVNESSHYGFEICTERDVLIVSSN